ncbi:hypothetical protein HSR122_0248 [Halapricum desulfuricans]|uniref:Uncharacterized protein n=1 Tax=Halapricum desulfuricans TaxID=2841257 RepID=A0A897N3Y0_9EURY|nr:hypothetical protein HSR122_0248 [Halapricum desulfuricans]
MTRAVPVCHSDRGLYGRSDGAGFDCPGIDKDDDLYRGCEFDDCVAGFRERVPERRLGGTVDEESRCVDHGASARPGKRILPPGTNRGHQ